MPKTFDQMLAAALAVDDADLPAGLRPGSVVGPRRIPTPFACGNAPAPRTNAEISHDFWSPFPTALRTKCERCGVYYGDHQGTPLDENDRPYVACSLCGGAYVGSGDICGGCRDEEDE